MGPGKSLDVTEEVTSRDPTRKEGKARIKKESSYFFEKK
jgi:hypothetical protein